MKKHLIILLLLISANIFAQNSIIAGNATYKMSSIHNPSYDKLRSKFKDRLIKDEEEVNGLQFCLNFNKIESSFAVCDKINLKKIMLFVKSKNLLYTNFSENFIKYNNSSAIMGTIADKEYIIKDTTKINWQLFQEKKVIDGYECFKAQTEYFYESKIPQKIVVTAWYCPALAFQTGPNGYYGLPGLIIELHDRNAIFGIEKIDLLEKNIIIEQPKTGNLINKTDFDLLKMQKGKELKEDNSIKNLEKK